MYGHSTDTAHLFWTPCWVKEFTSDFKSAYWKRLASWSMVSFASESTISLAKESVISSFVLNCLLERHLVSVNYVLYRIHVLIKIQCQSDPLSLSSKDDAVFQGLYSLRRRLLISIGIPITNLRRSSDRLRFIMGIPIPVRRTASS